MPLTAEQAVTGMAEYGQLRATEVGLFWVEYRPQDGGQNLLYRRSWSGEITRLTPESHSVRSRVCEYGGLSWCQAGNSIVFVNAADQQLWLQSLMQQDALYPLTATSDCRYGDPVFDSSHNRIIAVQQRESDEPTQPLMSLVSVCLESGRVAVLASGEDFYSCPVLDNRCDQLAWISWNHPDQPWTVTRLNLARVDTEGQLRCHSATVAQDSVQQPRFLSDNSLAAINDASGWWNLYRYLCEGDSQLTTASDQGLWPQQRDLGLAQWQSGVYTWDQAESGYLAGCYMEDGRGRLQLRRSDNEAWKAAEDFSLFRHLSCYRDHLFCVAYAEDRLPAIIEVAATEEGYETGVLYGGGVTEYPVTIPEPVSYPVAGEIAHGFFYAPFYSSEEERHNPPLIVFSHGGPTAATYPVLNPMIQFWNSHGFAVIDLNYRGSTGYGRSYRHRLAGNWGVSDWQDAVAAVDYLEQQQRIDPERVFIRGSSAGGYTTLSALAFSNRFRAGASYYGVSDPLNLAAATHKFESHYLDWLIGKPEEGELYRSRSPVHHAAQITCPVIFFQGGQDSVVVPQQTEVMVTALKQQGISTEMHLYPDEQHGFRLPQNRVAALKAELRFYQQQL